MECSNVVYIGEIHIHSKYPKDSDTLTWIRIHKDIIELNTLPTDEGGGTYVFQFVLGDAMVDLYSTFLTFLQNNKPEEVTNKMKLKIKGNIVNYEGGHAHQLFVTSIFPFQAIEYHRQVDKKKMMKNQDKYLQVMDVLVLIESIYGDSFTGNLLKQLISSMCYRQKEMSYTKDATCNGCISVNSGSEKPDNQQYHQTTSNVETGYEEKQKPVSESIVPEHDKKGNRVSV